MPIAILATVAFGVLFHRAAHHEHLSPFLWAALSIALSVAAMLLGGGVGATAAVQVVLYIAMWWHNARRRGGRAASPGRDR